MAKEQSHILKQLSLADWVTLCAVAVVTIAFWLLWLGHLYIAVSCVFFSMFLDYLDGTVARKYGASHYGKVLDSLYDVLGWVVFPSFIINIQANWEWWSMIVTTLYCVSSAIRLSRFTLDGYFESDNKYYVGLPVLFSKYALLLSFFFHALLATLFLAGMIPLMISSKLIRKPHPLLAQLELLYSFIFLIISFVHV